MAMQARKGWVGWGGFGDKGKGCVVWWFGLGTLSLWLGFLGEKSLFFWRNFMGSLQDLWFLFCF